MVVKKKIELSPEQLTWLRQAYKDRLHPEQMAAHLECHVDTVKRLLDRHGIRIALSSKHITTDQPPPQWNRPCNMCRCTESRPKFQYTCNRCKSHTRDLHHVHEDFHAY